MCKVGIEVAVGKGGKRWQEPVGDSGGGGESGDRRVPESELGHSNGGTLAEVPLRRSFSWKPKGMLMRHISMNCWRSGVGLEGDPRRHLGLLRRFSSTPRVPAGRDWQFTLSYQADRHQKRRRVPVESWSEAFFEVPVQAVGSRRTRP